jgi:K+/H+ antiporter YhaU regulatory subunit KhtT
MEIYEIPLPGIGVRYEFTSEAGDTVLVMGSDDAVGNARTILIG